MNIRVFEGTLLKRDNKHRVTTTGDQTPVEPMGFIRKRAKILTVYLLTLYISFLKKKSYYPYE